MFKILSTLLALLLPVAAFAQGAGQVGPGQVLGNSSAAKRPATSEDLSNIINRAMGSAQGSIITRKSTGWTVLPPGANGTYLRSNGAGADLSYGTGTGSTVPGGTSGQIQYNNGGSFAGATGDAGVTGGVLSVNAVRGVPVDPSSSVQNDVLVFDTGTYVHKTFAGLVNAVCSLAPLTCTSLFGYAYAGWWGVKCDNTANDGPAINTALAAIGYAKLTLPAGTCKISSQIAYNAWTTNAGLLTVPGIQLRGQGRDATKLSTFIPGDYMIAVNQAWAALHQSMWSANYEAGSGSMSLGGPYYLRISMTTPAGDEIDVPRASKSFTFPASSAAVRVQLQPVPAGYCYNVYFDLADAPQHYGTVSGSPGVCLGGNQSILITAIGTFHAYPTDKFGVWQQASLEDMSLVNPNNTASSSAVLWFRTGYSEMRNVYVNNFKKDGLVQPSWSGDNDGWFVTTLDRVKFDSISGWCYNGAGYTLENSNLTIRDSIFNACGTLTTNMTVPITVHDIANGSPGIIETNIPHTLQNGDDVLLQNLVGSSITTQRYRVCVVQDLTHFSVCTLDGLSSIPASGVYSINSGTFTLLWRPPQMQANGSGPTATGGAVAYLGLISNIINNGFTVNNNVDIYYAETGSSDNATLIGNDMENTWGTGLYVASGININWINGECLSNTTRALGYTVQCMQLGTAMNAGNVINVTVDGVKVRNDLGLAFGFTQYPGGASVTYSNTVKIKNIYWQTFFGNQYVGFDGNPEPFFWIRFDGKTGGVCTIKASFNIEPLGCSRLSTGTYQLVFGNHMKPSDANYAVQAMGQQAGVSYGVMQVSGLTTNSLNVICAVPSTSAVQDCDVVSVVGYAKPGTGYLP